MYQRLYKPVISLNLNSHPSFPCRCLGEHWGDPPSWSWKLTIPYQVYDFALTVGEEVIFRLANSMTQTAWQLTWKGRLRTARTMAIRQNTLSPLPVPAIRNGLYRYISWVGNVQPEIHRISPLSRSCAAWYFPQGISLCCDVARQAQRQNIRPALRVLRPADVSWYSIRNQRLLNQLTLPVIGGFELCCAEGRYHFLYPS